MGDGMDELLSSCDGLIKKIAASFYGIDKEELYHVGQIGLFKAYQHYEKSSNTKFSSFAYTYIFGEMYELARSRKLIMPP